MFANDGGTLCSMLHSRFKFGTTKSPNDAGKVWRKFERRFNVDQRQYTSWERQHSLACAVVDDGLQGKRPNSSKAMYDV